VNGLDRACTRMYSHPVELSTRQVADCQQDFDRLASDGYVEHSQLGQLLKCQLAREIGGGWPYVQRSVRDDIFNSFNRPGDTSLSFANSMHQLFGEYTTNGTATAMANEVVVGAVSQTMASEVVVGAVWSRAKPKTEAEAENVRADPALKAPHRMPQAKQPPQEPSCQDQEEHILAGSKIESFCPECGISVGLKSAGMESKYYFCGKPFGVCANASGKSVVDAPSPLHVDTVKSDYLDGETTPPKGSLFHVQTWRAEAATTEGTKRRNSLQEALSPQPGTEQPGTGTSSSSSSPRENRPNRKSFMNSPDILTRTSSDIARNCLESTVAQLRHAQARELFDKYDADDSGSIDKTEIQQLIVDYLTHALSAEDLGLLDNPLQDFAEGSRMYCLYSLNMISEDGDLTFDKFYEWLQSPDNFLKFPAQKFQVEQLCLSGAA